MTTSLSDPRNPAMLVAPGTRARLDLHRGVTADVVRGARPGPILWLWVVRGNEDPSLQLALGTLRDAIDPAELCGAVGFIVEGPASPIGREAHPHGALVTAIARGAAGVVLMTGAPAGHRVLPHAAADPSQARDRRLAAELALPLIAPATLLPALNRNLLVAPTAWLVAGERGRLDRDTVEHTREALGALLVGLGLQPGTRSKIHRSLVRRLVEIPSRAPGLCESTILPGALVAKNQVVAQIGAPGLTDRYDLRAPTAGVALYVRGGWLLDGAAVVLATPPVAIAPRTTRPPTAGHELGWCELVDLPELGVSRLPAKIDTGARTSALHVQARRLIGRERGRVLWEIEVPAGDGGRTSRTVKARVEVIEESVVRDSGGHAERRAVIETALRIGDRVRRVRVSLTDRGDMRFPMLVGRTALDAQTRIDPTRAFVTRPARRTTRRSPHQA